MGFGFREAGFGECFGFERLPGLGEMLIRPLGRFQRPRQLPNPPLRTELDSAVPVWNR